MSRELRWYEVRARGAEDIKADVQAVGPFEAVREHYSLQPTYVSGSARAWPIWMVYTVKEEGGLVHVQVRELDQLQHDVPRTPGKKFSNRSQEHIADYLTHHDGEGPVEIEFGDKDVEWPPPGWSPDEEEPEY